MTIKGISARHQQRNANTAHHAQRERQQERQDYFERGNLFVKIMSWLCCCGYTRDDAEPPRRPTQATSNSGSRAQGNR